MTGINDKMLVDMEIAMKLTTHIENPCSVNVGGESHNIRGFYIRLAKEVMPIITSPYAKEFLESVLRQYEGVNLL